MSTVAKDLSSRKSGRRVGLETYTNNYIMRCSIHLTVEL